MPRPTPGQLYTVVEGDNLSLISAAAYGIQSRWRDIWAANKTRLRSDDPNLIFPGEIIIIPGLVEKERLKPNIDLPDKDPNDFTIVIDSTELVVTGARAVRTMDTMADGFSATVQFDVNDDKMYELLRPYKYRDAKVYVGGKRIITGTLYLQEPTVSTDGALMSIEGASRTADLIDSSVSPPLESRGVTLEQIAKSQCDPRGIPMVFSASPGERFAKVTADKTATIGDFLTGLARQRRGVFSSSVTGELVFQRAQIGEPVGTLAEGIPPVLGLSCRYDGRQRFNAYRVFRDTRNSKKSAIAKDTVVPKSRFKNLMANDSDVGNVQSVADWQRSKSLTGAMSLDVEVNSWYNSAGNLWSENTIVTLQSKTLYIAQGFNFIVRSVEYIYQPDGIKSRLSLVPPQVYTGEQIEEPWL